MEGIILQGISKADLLEDFRAIVIEEIKASQQAELKALYLSPEKACNLFDPKISKTTLWNWVKDGRITKYNIGGKVVYKHSEIIAAVETVQRFKKAS